MNRSQVVGFGFIGAVAIVGALWLWLSAPMTSPATKASPLDSSTTTALPDDAMAARARTQAEHLARDAAAANPENAPNSTTTNPTNPTKRATRDAKAQELARRLELIGQAIDEARKQPQATLTRTQVQDGVHGVQPQIVDCYEQALAQNPALAGGLKVMFEIGPDPDDATRGAVVAGEVDSALGSPFFEACVLQQIVGASFPRPEGGGVVKVTYPFRFASSEDAADADAAKEAAAAK